MWNRFRWWLTLVVRKLLFHLPHSDTVYGDGAPDWTGVTRWHFHFHHWEWDVVLMDEMRGQWARRLAVVTLHHCRKVSATCPQPLQPLLNYVLPLRIRQGITEWVLDRARVDGNDGYATMARRGPLALVRDPGRITVTLGKLLFTIEE